MIKLFTLTFVGYSLYALLPFIQVGRTLHYLLGAIFAVTGSLIWVTISRTVDKSQISLYGLYFDAIITISFFAIPLLFTSLNFTLKQVVGITLILTGILISKL